MYGNSSIFKGKVHLKKTFARYFHTLKRAQGKRLNSPLNQGSDTSVSEDTAGVGGASHRGGGASCICSSVGIGQFDPFGIPIISCVAEKS